MCVHTYIRIYMHVYYIYYIFILYMNIYNNHFAVHLKLTLQINYISI